MFLLFIAFLMQANPGVDLFQVKVLQEVFQSDKECRAAAQTILGAAEKDTHVADIIAAACIPTDMQSVSK